MQDKTKLKKLKEMARTHAELARRAEGRILDREMALAAAKEEARFEHERTLARSAEYEFKRDPITEVPDEVKLPTDYFDGVQTKVEYNQFFADYYQQRYIDTNRDQFKHNAERIRNCHKSWFGDHYKKSGYFNVKRVFHCHNRWCWLCNHLKQAKRLYEYHLKFEELLKSYDLYHIVFTVPNCYGDVLKDTLNRMQNGLKKIIRYFQGFAKIADIDFKQYGFVGALRSFEIVIYPTEFHPHLHCLFLMNKNLDFPRTEINNYSFSYGRLVRKYSKFEILLQKMFYLAFNGKKITLENIQAVPIGYSCTADYVEGDAWHEVFKYATKMSKDGASVCTYEQFTLLDDIFHKFKMLQGYGIFYNDEEVKSESDIQAEILFEKVLILLNKIEAPERDVSIELEELVNELHKKRLTVISKKLSYKYLKSVVDELRAELHIDGERFEPF